MAQKKPNSAIPRDPQRGGGSVYPPPPPPTSDPMAPKTPAWQQLAARGIAGQGSAAANRAALQDSQQQPAPTRPQVQFPTQPDVRPTGQHPLNPNADGNMVDYSPGNPNAARDLLNDPRNNAQGRTPPFVDPSQTKPLQLDGQPGQMDTATALQHLQSYLAGNKAPGGAAPGVASMDGLQQGQPGPAGMFNHAGQQLGVGDQQDQNQQSAGGQTPSVDGGVGGMPSFSAQPGTGSTGLSGGSFSGQPGGGLPVKPFPLPGGNPGAGGFAFNPAMRQTLKGILAGGGGGVTGQPRPTQPVLAGGPRY